MVCGCSKNLGCFTKDDVVDTGILAIGDGDYIFHINYNGQYITETQALLLGESLTLTNTFNEDAEICFKIEFPTLLKGDGVNYVTSSDGACLFCFDSIIKGC